MAKRGRKGIHNPIRQPGKTPPQRILLQPIQRLSPRGRLQQDLLRSVLNLQKAHVLRQANFLNLRIRKR